jgi:hypothetical protein
LSLLPVASDAGFALIVRETAEGTYECVAHADGRTDSLATILNLKTHPRAADVVRAVTDRMRGAPDDLLAHAVAAHVVARYDVTHQVVGPALRTVALIVRYAGWHVIVPLPSRIRLLQGVRQKLYMDKIWTAVGPPTTEPLNRQTALPLFALFAELHRAFPRVPHFRVDRVARERGQRFLLTRSDVVPRVPVSVGSGSAYVRRLRTAYDVAFSTIHGNDAFIRFMEQRAVLDKRILRAEAALLRVARRDPWLMDTVVHLRENDRLSPAAKRALVRAAVVQRLNGHDEDRPRLSSFASRYISLVADRWVFARSYAIHGAPLEVYPGEIIVIGHDLSPELIAALCDGHARPVVV